LQTHSSLHKQILFLAESLTEVSDLSTIEGKLLELLNVVQGQASEILNRPIQDESDFKAQLKQLKKAYKQGRFDRRLAVANQHLTAYLRTVKETETPEYYKARTLVYELNDILPVDPEIDVWTFEDGQRVYSDLQRLSDRWVTEVKLTDYARKLVREKILFCGCYGHGLKRRSESERAQQVFHWLLEFTTNRIVTPQMPAYGTRANLTYNLGSIYRALEQHDRSEAMYAQALRFYHDRTKVRSKKDFDDLAFTTRRIAMCIGLGFGWLQLTRGNLHRAEHALITSRSLIAKSPDPIVPLFIEMLYGSMRRCRAGNDRKELNEAIRSLKLARRAFQRHKHPRYHARACSELTLAYAAQGEFVRALMYLNVAEDYAQRHQEYKWLANVHIRRSRIRRGQGDYEQALTEAEKAIEKIENSEEVVAKADAYIARGEAQFCLAGAGGLAPPSYEVARADFSRARRLLKKDKHAQGRNGKTLNPKIASVCVLRIAQCYAREGDQVNAKRFFQRWTKYKATVEHEWVRALAKEVAADISNLDDFFSISSRNPAEWNYYEQINRLRAWIYTQAMKHTNNNATEGAELTGLKRPVFVKLREPVKRLHTKDST
jgi:tetratricopeptide (TPR) repeat protein